METLRIQNLEQWIQQWKAIQFPRKIPIEEKLRQYREWKNIWDIWYFAPNLTLEQVKRIAREKNDERKD